MKKTIIIAIAALLTAASANAKKHAYVFDDGEGQSAMVSLTELGIMMDDFPFAEKDSSFTATVTYYGSDYRFEGSDDVAFVSSGCGYKFSVCTGEKAAKVFRMLQKHSVRITAETANGQRFDLEVKPLKDAKKFDWD